MDRHEEPGVRLVVHEHVCGAVEGAVEGAVSSTVNNAVAANISSILGN